MPVMLCLMARGSRIGIDLGEKIGEGCIEDGGPAPIPIGTRIVFPRRSAFGICFSAI
jgi:hypothetical protein